MFIFKKSTFLYITTFVLAVGLAFFSSYFVVREVRGVALGNDIDMNINRVYDFASPVFDDDAATRFYFESIAARCLWEDGTQYCVDDLCDLNDFSFNSL